MDHLLQTHSLGSLLFFSFWWQWGGSSLFGMHNQMTNSMMSQMHSSSFMFDGFDTGQSQQQIMMSSSS